MEIKELLSYVLGAIVLAFNIGIYFKKLIGLPDKDKIQDMIYKEINNYVNRADNKYLEITQIVKETNKQIRDLEKYMSQEKENTLLITGNLKAQISEIRINLKSLCEYLGHKYIDGNNRYEDQNKI